MKKELKMMSWLQ